jgi:hypothetical protein
MVFNLLFSIFFYRNQKLQEFIDQLINDPSYQMKSPGVTTCIGGKNKTLYISRVASIEEATRYCYSVFLSV